MNEISRFLCMLLLTLISCQCSLASSGNKLNTGIKDAGHGYNFDLHEIERQNQITTQILQNYLEKKLFGQNRSSKPPSLWDILPRLRRKYANNIQEAINATQSNEREILESVESERVTAYEDYGDNDEYFEGRFLKYNFTCY